MITPTPRGWGLLVAGLGALVAAYLLGQVTILVPAALLLGALAISACTLLPAVRARSADLTLPKHVREGETAEVRIDAGRLFTGGWFRWRSPATGRWSSWEDLDGSQGTMLLPDLDRGVYPMPRVRMRVADPLRLWHARTTLRSAAALAVGPVVAELEPQVSAGFGSQSYATLSGVTDQVDQLVRDHRREDGMRRVHWKQSAKHDRLMVRKEEPPARGAASVVLDTLTGGRGGREELDAIVRTFASVVVALREAGVAVELTETGEAQLPPDAGRLQERRLVRALARVEARDRGRVRERGRQERVHVVTGAEPTPEVRALIASLGRADVVWGATDALVELGRAQRVPLIEREQLTLEGLLA